jgi:hypothetical protein
MGSFTQLEEAALHEVCLRFPDDKTALTAQLATAQVQSRENTGAGFYTRFEVTRGNPLSGDRMRAAAKIACVCSMSANQLPPSPVA